VLMQTVQQNALLILKSVSHFVTDPELMRPFNSVTTHYLEQKVMTRKAMARSARLRMLEITKGRSRGNIG